MKKLPTYVGWNADQPKIEEPLPGVLLIVDFQCFPLNGFQLSFYEISQQLDYIKEIQLMLNIARLV